MSAQKGKAGIGSSFDDFLKEEGIYEEAQEFALLRVFAWKIREAMKAKAISKVEMAKRMNTSRSQLDRILDPQNDHVELATLMRAADAVGHKLSLDLVA
ncbi:MAG: Fis family transcriptional regulator [Hyphomonadaceae bacterium BRH_c29]|nr:MAG: Fis family transcriptional regulator [Hyphomonadaceae bacterium BRH_c29]|tara:strand:+ start:6618 stop:6914 length:297 start_codon:yes stop_codon:yes gene_type:complete